MKTSEVLYRAADGIEAFGHMKGSGYGEGDVTTAPACIIGAINRASWDDSCNVTDPPAHDAQAAMRAYLPHRVGIVGWNDDQDRTAAEVIEVLRAAAVIEAAKETADERESVTR